MVIKHGPAGSSGLCWFETLLIKFETSQTETERIEIKWQIESKRTISRIRIFKRNGLFMTTKTVVGDAITVGDTIILPLVDVSFGMGATAKAEGVKSGGGGGIGGKMTPSAVLLPRRCDEAGEHQESGQHDQDP